MMVCDPLCLGVVPISILLLMIGISLPWFMKFPGRGFMKLSCHILGWRNKVANKVIKNIQILPTKKLTIDGVSGKLF